MEGKGYFITIEGCEGVGKTTQINLLKQYLTHHNIPALFTREPGGTPTAEKIREVILDPSLSIEPLTELLLYTAARSQHVNEYILPKLKMGYNIICDRFIHSTIAYQGYGRGLDKNVINNLCALAVKDLSIDLTIFLDLVPSEGFNRKGGADKSDRMDSESMEFHTRVYNGFKEILSNGKNVAVIDASGSAQQTHERIVNALKERRLV